MKWLIIAIIVFFLVKWNRFQGEYMTDNIIRFRANNNENVYFSKTAWEQFAHNTDDNIRFNILTLVNLIAEITGTLKEFHTDLDGFFISSTYRNQSNSAHSDGRAIDISSVKLKDKFYSITISLDLEVWEHLFYILRQHYNQHKLNQVITPYFCLDSWNTEENKVKLIEEHQDHIHISKAR